MLNFKIHFLSILQNINLNCCCSVTESCPTLWPHGLQHARLPCPSQFPRVCLNSYPLSWWHYATISSSASPFSSPQSFPTSGSFPTSWLFTSGGQSIGASVSSFQWIFRADFLQDWLVWSPCCPRDSQESSLAPQLKNINFLMLSLLLPELHEPGPMWG